MRIEKQIRDAWVADVPLALKTNDTTAKGFKSDDIVHYEGHLYIVVRAAGEHMMQVKIGLQRGMKYVYQAAFERVEII